MDIDIIAHVDKDTAIYTGAAMCKGTDIDSYRYG